MEPKRVTVNNLINNPSFRRWVLFSTSADNIKWQHWMKMYPEYHSQVQEAKELLLALSPEDSRDTTQAEERVWLNIKDKTAEKNFIVGKTDRTKRFPTWKVAASVAIGLASSVLLYLWFFTPSYVSVSTAYGEVQEFMLPDSSWVVLNANSSLRYQQPWEPNVDREVWLEGEAFFKVTERFSQPASQKNVKFTVHTNSLEVEVLGTEFSVNHRNQETEVVLSEGKVRVVNTRQNEEVILKPGEMINYSGQTMLLSQVDASTKTSWKEELMVFKDEPLANIFERLGDTYGYEVNVADEGILERRFSGSYPRDSVQLLLEKLEKLYQLTITENERELNVRK